MRSIINKQEIFETNSSTHNVKTRNKHHFHIPNAKLSCFQKSTFYTGIKIFNSLPPSVKMFKNDKAKFKEALRKYLHTHSMYSVMKFFMYKDDLQYCFCKMFVVLYAVNLCTCVFTTCATSYCLYDTLLDPSNIYIGVCVCAQTYGGEGACVCVHGMSRK